MVAPSIKSRMKNAIIVNPALRPLIRYRSALKMAASGKLRLALETARAPMNSGFCWVKETESFKTTFNIYNYWTENYGINGSLPLTITVFDNFGVKIGTQKYDVQPDGVAVMNARMTLDDLGIPIPFEGSFVYTLRHNNLFTNRPIQGNMDYRYHPQKSTSVHGLATYTGISQEHAPSDILIDDEPGENTTLVIHNTYPYRKSPWEKTVVARVEIFDHQGNLFTKTLETDPIPACGFQKVSLRDDFPGVYDFLDGNVGLIKTWSDVPASRYLVITENDESGAVKVNHAAGVKSTDESLNFATKSDGWDLGRMYIIPFPIERGGDFECEYQMSGISKDMPAYDIDVTIHNDAGELISELQSFATIPLYSSAVRLLGNEILDAAGVPSDLEEFKGNVTFSVRHDASHPGILKGQSVIFRLRDRKSGDLADVNVGPDIVNVGAAAAGVRSRVVPRTKIFAHLLEIDDWETSLFLVNQSSLKNYDKISQTKITVYSPDGPTGLEATVEIPPYGSAWFKVNELFPNVREILKPHEGRGFIKARDLKVREYGYYTIRNTSTGAVAADHLYGG
jgi:hypothetical protein